MAYGRPQGVKTMWTHVDRGRVKTRFSCGRRKWM